MFISVPTLEFDAPAALLAPGASCWRAMQLSLHLPWFIAGFEMVDKSGPNLVTICFAWDTDLVSAISTLQGDKVLDLTCMLPPWQSSSGRWEAKTIVAIYRSVNTEHGDVYMFETDDGAHLSPMYGRPMSAAQRRELVARIP